MNKIRIQPTTSYKVGDAIAFWKSSFRAGAAAARGVMNTLCIMPRPQGLSGT
ncbi:MAG: hypothetical protein ABR958_10285 [Dehalococcoidales bacterium]